MIRSTGSSSIGSVRTTLNIADDVLLAAKELGKRERKSTGRVISELARRALLRSEVPHAAEGRDGEPETFFGFRPLPRRGVLVMHDIDDVPVGHVASVLGIPLFTVYSRLRKARRELEAAVRRLLKEADA